MATAQNGWPVVPNTDAGRRKLTDLVLPGTMPHPVRVLAGDVATIAHWHVREYHRRVEPIKPAGCWGWNVRKIGDGPDWSNHAAACAWDLNAPDNPDGTPTSKVMTPAQIAECHALERESSGVLRWGGDWSDPDAMHWEVVGTPAQAAVFAEKIRGELPMEQAEFNRLMNGWASTPTGTAALNGITLADKIGDKAYPTRTVGDVLRDAAKLRGVLVGDQADTANAKLPETSPLARLIETLPPA